MRNRRAQRQIGRRPLLSAIDRLAQHAQAGPLRMPAEEDVKHLSFHRLQAHLAAKPGHPVGVQREQESIAVHLLSTTWTGGHRLSPSLTA